MNRGTGKPKSPSEEQIARVLRCLRALGGWTTYRQLAVEAGTSPRTARLCASVLVERGTPLVTDSVKGYRLVSDAAELREAAGKLKHRAGTIYQRAAALEATAARLDARQLELLA